MSVLLRVLLALIALLVLAAAVVFLALRPPAPLPVPAQGATLAAPTSRSGRPTVARSGSSPTRV